MKTLYLLFISMFLMSVLSAQTNTIIVSSNENQILDTKSFAKEAAFSINYSPLFGFYMGFCALGANISYAKGFLELSATYALKSEDIQKGNLEISFDPGSSAIFTMFGPRYVIPSKGITHFFIHGLIGAGYTTESIKDENFPVDPYKISNLGAYFSPGFGVYFKKLSKPGFRLGLDIITGYTTIVEIENPNIVTESKSKHSFNGGFQFTAGYILTAF